MRALFASTALLCTFVLGQYLPTPPFQMQIMRHVVSGNVPGLLWLISRMESRAHGAKIDFCFDPTGAGATYPLAEAVNNNNFEVAELLLKKGASVSCPFEARPIVQTAIMAHASPKTVKLLIEHGAAIAKDGVFNAVCYLLPPMSATEQELKSFSDFIHQHVPTQCLDIRDGFSYTPLSYAASGVTFASYLPVKEMCHPATISMLLAAGASLEATGPLDLTPIDFMIQNRVDGPERFWRVIFSTSPFQKYAGRDIYEHVRHLIPTTVDRLPFLQQIAPARRQRARLYHQASLIRELVGHEDVWAVVAEFYFRIAARGL